MSVGVGKYVCVAMLIGGGSVTLHLTSGICSECAELISAFTAFPEFYLLSVVLPEYT